MTYAIELLKIALATAQNNEPIQRAEGRIEEADACRTRGESIIEALALIDCHQQGYLTEPETFQGKIARAINCHSLESGSDTPDFILAEYLKRCLENFNETMAHRMKYFKAEGDEVFGAEPAPQYRILEKGEILQEGDICGGLPVRAKFWGDRVHLSGFRRPIVSPVPDPTGLG